MTTTSPVTMPVFPWLHLHPMRGGALGGLVPGGVTRLLGLFVVLRVVLLVVLRNSLIALLSGLLLATPALAVERVAVPPWYMPDPQDDRLRKVVELLYRGEIEAGLAALDGLAGQREQMGERGPARWHHLRALALAAQKRLPEAWSAANAAAQGVGHAPDHEALLFWLARGHVLLLRQQRIGAMSDAGYAMNGLIKLEPKLTPPLAQAVLVHVLGARGVVLGPEKTLAWQASVLLDPAQRSSLVGSVWAGLAILTADMEGMRLLALGDDAAALRAFRAAVEIERAVQVQAGDAHAAMLRWLRFNNPAHGLHETLLGVARSGFLVGQTDEAAKALREGLALALGQLGRRDRAETGLLAVIRPALAKAGCRAVQKASPLGLPGHDGAALQSLLLNEVGYCWNEHGQGAEAEPILDAALALERSVEPRQPAALATLLHNRGLARLQLGRFADALADYRSAIELRSATGHPLLSQSQLGVMMSIGMAASRPAETLSDASRSEFEQSLRAVLDDTAFLRANDVLARNNICGLLQIARLPVDGKLRERAAPLCTAAPPAAAAPAAPASASAVR